jgi:hypothetical protein
MPLVNISGRLRESKVSWRPVKIAQLLLACLVVEWRSECANVEIGNGYAVGDAVLAVRAQIACTRLFTHFGFCDDKSSARVACMVILAK